MGGGGAHVSIARCCGLGEVYGEGEGDVEDDVTWVGGGEDVELL